MKNNETNVCLFGVDIYCYFILELIRFLLVNRIWNATEERQTEARELSSRVDAMIVIGGKTSSNSQKLYEICN